MPYLLIWAVPTAYTRSRSFSRRSLCPSLKRVGLYVGWLYSVNMSSVIACEQRFGGYVCGSCVDGCFLSVLRAGCCCSAIDYTAALLLCTCHVCVLLHACVTLVKVCVCVCDADQPSRCSVIHQLPHNFEANIPSNCSVNGTTVRST